MPRLQPRESALVAVTVRAADVLGAADASGRYTASTRGDREIDFRQTVTGLLRLADRVQLGINLPFVETYRATQARAALGGGFGDVSISARYDLTYADAGRRWPGFAVAALVAAPSGVSPQRSKSALLNDITGTGAWQATVGLTAEYAWGKWLASLNGALAGYLPQKLGPLLTGFVGLAYVLESHTAVSMTVTTSQRLQGGHVNQSAVTLVMSAVLPVNAHFRFQGSVLGDVSALGRSTPVTLGANVAVVYAWL